MPARILGCWRRAGAAVARRRAYNGHVKSPVQTNSELLAGRTLSDAPVADPIIKQIESIAEEYELSWRVLLYNDDFHSMDEVVLQIQKATGYSLEKSEAIMLEAHTTGAAIVYVGEQDECAKVAAVLEQIGLSVAVESG